MINGWKTITGAILIAAGAGLKALGYDEIAQTIYVIGEALGMIGVAHKIEKGFNKK